MADQLRYSVQRTGDGQVDRNLDLIRATFDQVAAVIVAIRPGSSGVNTAEAIVDFGAGSDLAAAVVSASWATTTSKIVASVGDDARADDAAIEGITVGVSDHAAGSFRVWAAAPLGAIGQYKVHAIGVS